MIRVANVIEEGRIGGPQVRIVRVAAALINRAETLVIMPRTSSKAFRAICAANRVPYRALGISRITKAWRGAVAYILFSPVEVVRLARVLRRERINLVHASGGSAQYKAIIAAWLAGIPVVWHLNDTFAPRWVRLLFRFLAPLASGFVFASYRSQAYYSSLICVRRPQTVVPATVDTVKFDPSIVLEPDPDLPKDGPVIGTVANVNPIKGLETLIRSAARLRDMGHAPHVVILGGFQGRQRCYRERLAAMGDQLGLERLYFIGPRTDVRSVLQRLDVYICCSVAESSPASVWEAMAMSRAIVATDVGDVARHIHDGEAGFIVPVGDDAAMARRVAYLLNAPDRRIQMGKAARAAAEVFHPEEVAQRTYDIYARVLSDRLINAAGKKGFGIGKDD